MSKHDTLAKLVVPGSRLTLTEQNIGELASRNRETERELLVTQVHRDDKGVITSVEVIFSEPKSPDEYTPFHIEVPSSEDLLIVGREQFTTTTLPVDKHHLTTVKKYQVEAPRAGMQGEPEPAADALPKAVDAGGEMAATVGAPAVVEPEVKSQTQIDAEDAVAKGAGKTK